MTDPSDAIHWACDVVRASTVLTDEQKRLWCVYAVAADGGDGVIDDPRADAIIGALAGLPPDRVRQVRAELEALGMMGREPGGAT